MANSLTFTLSPAGGSAIEYSALYRTPGRYATYFFPQASEDQIIRSHISGTNGNIKVIGGRATTVFRCGVRFIGESVAAAISAAITDFDALSGVDVTLTFNGTEWARCTLRTALPLRPARTDGRGYASADYEIILDCDN